MTMTKTLLFPMCNYSYVAVDVRGIKTRGTLDVNNQIEAVERIKQMGLFPTRVIESGARTRRRGGFSSRSRGLEKQKHSGVRWFGRRGKATILGVATPQLATLVEAGMPPVRGLRMFG